MKYDELYDNFIDMFPEDAEFFAEKEEETNVGRDTMNLMFGLIITPFIKAIADKDPIKTKKAFEYVEKMENDDNPEIGNIAEVNILEDLISDAEGIDKYLEYMGDETKKAVRHISQFFLNEKSS